MIYAQLRRGVLEETAVLKTNQNLRKITVKNFVFSKVADRETFLRTHFSQNFSVRLLLNTKVIFDR